MLAAHRLRRADRTRLGDFPKGLGRVRDGLVDRRGGELSRGELEILRALLQESVAGEPPGAAELRLPAAARTPPSGPGFDRAGAAGALSMDSSVRILSRSAGALWLILLLAALPLVLWHRVLSDVLVSFHWSPVVRGRRARAVVAAAGRGDVPDPRGGLLRVFTRRAG